MSPQEIAEILTGYARNVAKGDGYAVVFVAAQPATDWAGAIGHDAHYRLTLPDGRVRRFGSDKTKLASLKARVRKELTANDRRE